MIYRNFRHQSMGEEVPQRSVNFPAERKGEGEDKVSILISYEKKEKEKGGSYGTHGAVENQKKGA